MTVYVESNFVLEIALGQEQSEAAAAILSRAERGEIELAIPSFALSEPFSTVMHRSRSRKKLSNELKDHVRDLNRSIPHQPDAAVIEPVAELLLQANRRESQSLVATVERLFACATVIQLDVSIYRHAMRYVAQYGLSEQDAIILASVVSHLRETSSLEPHFFISRNWTDFANPLILDELDQLGCTFVANFREGAVRLEQPGV
jgi:predicted nucleic acid-binding protein